MLANRAPESRPMETADRGDPPWVGWLVGMILAQVLASVPPAAPAWYYLLPNALFWVSLIGYLDPRRPAGGAWRALALAPIYGLTFLANREGIAQPDHVFNSDTFRYLAEAATLDIQARHIGLPVITFVREGWDRLGSIAGVSNLGREVLHAQTALGGALTIVAFRRLLDRLAVPGFAAWTAAAALAAALATWTFAAVVESYVFTALLVILAIDLLLGAAANVRRTAPVVAALLAVVALGFSLENLFVPVMAAGAFLVWGRSWRRAALHLAVVAVVFGAWISGVAAARGGSAFYATWGDQGFPRPATNLPENLRHFASETWDASRWASPKDHAETLARTFLAAAVGRPGEPPWSYAKFIGREDLLTPPRLGLALSLLAAGALGAPGMLRRWRQHGPERVAISLAVATLLARHFFILAFSPREGILFAIPSIAAAYLLLALGASERPRAVGAALGIAAAICAAVNAIYLAQIATS